MDDNSLRVAMALRLGCNVCEPHLCIYCSTIEANGYHGLTCQRSSGIFPLPPSLKDIIRRAVVTANVPCMLESSGLSRSDGHLMDPLEKWALSDLRVYANTLRDKAEPRVAFTQPTAETARHVGKDNLIYSAGRTHVCLVSRRTHPPKRRWTSLPMNIRKPRGVTSALPTLNKKMISRERRLG
ncbi:hypothetical protein EVAR_30616_1 [Eumeta japonica]|uniref:Uncharacterized protein n=1 Tax=Eumeta variegata TaxID=151549 RepID=A0A4C1WBJ9_EUMVA|nr:hypothetical protein EVAR_30616_1 [Eumeta japonica]